MVLLNNYNNALEYNLGISQEIDYICEEFFNRYSLNYFAYLIFLNNGSILRLSNHQSWTKSYFKGRLYNERNFYTDHWKRVTLGGSKKFLWVSQPQTKIHEGWRNNGIGNGFSIYKRKSNFLETCSFGTYLENYKANDLYIKYGADFDNFIGLFKKKATHLLRLDRPTHLITPDKKIFMNTQYKKNLFLNEKQIEVFLNRINLT